MPYSRCPQSTHALVARLLAEHFFENRFERRSVAAPVIVKRPHSAGNNYCGPQGGDEKEGRAGLALREVVPFNSLIKDRKAVVRPGYRCGEAPGRNAWQLRFLSGRQSRFIVNLKSD